MGKRPFAATAVKVTKQATLVKITEVFGLAEQGWLGKPRSNSLG